MNQNLAETASSDSTDLLQSLDRQHHLHPFTNLGEYSKKGGRVISRAEHIYIYDSDGKKILDGMSGLWCCGLGYSQDSIVEAVHEQMQQLPYYNSFFNCSNPPAIELASLLAEVTPDGFNHVFFTNSGSEANDTNIRLVHRYFDVLGKTDKKQIISRKNAYHGSTIAAGSLGGMGYMHEQYIGLNYVHHIDQPYWFAEGADQDPDSFGLQVARQLEQKILELGVENVAAFIAEPVQGAGGVIIPPDSYWPEISRICKEYEILLIADEVITGFGRTGNWFGSETFGIEPDLITFAKGVTNGYLPLGGVMVGEKVGQALTGSDSEFNHGLTYSAHPACCAAGVATIKIFQETDVLERVQQDIAEYFQSRMREFTEHAVVGEVRGRGMFAAIELVSDKSSRARLAPDALAAQFCRDVAIEHGLMIRATGDALIFSPPLICDRTEIDLIIQRLAVALDATAANYNIA